MLITSAKKGVSADQYIIVRQSSKPILWVTGFNPG